MPVGMCTSICKLDGSNLAFLLGASSANTNGSCVWIYAGTETTMAQVIADERAFKQILINLLSNAVKFTPAGGQVRVSARIEGRSLSLEVADTGMGVKQADLPRLGDAFFQAGGAAARNGEGTGLGLSVVRGLVGILIGPKCW